MPDLDLSLSLALLEMERQAIVILKNGLNDKIDELAAGRWATEDAAFYDAMGLVDPIYEVEHIEDTNFYPGHVPSLIGASVDKYPNVATIASETNSGTSNLDWGENRIATLAVEVMVRSHVVLEDGKTEPEDNVQDQDLFCQLEVNVRSHRTADAVHQLLATENGRKLGGLVPMFAQTPTVTRGDVFVRKEEKGRGPRWYFQGVRLVYNVMKPVNYG